ncbi:MAG: hypothetical protein AAFQ36_12065 [Pseudomonadota bacterium]
MLYLFYDTFKTATLMNRTDLERSLSRPDPLPPRRRWEGQVKPERR